ESRKLRPGPPTAACGGNGGRARGARGLAAAAPEARYRGPGSAATRREHGSCWPLPSSVCRRLHGPECGRSLRCSSSTIHTGIAFVVAPCARLTIPMRATLCTFTTGSLGRKLDQALAEQLLLVLDGTDLRGIAIGEAGRAEPAVVFDRPQEVLERKVAERVGPDESTNFLDRLGRADQLALGGRVDAVVAGTDDRGGG